MGFILESKKDFTPLEDGIYQAVCVGIYDIGTQVNKFDGKERHKLIIEWEIQTGDTHYVYKTYTASLRPNSVLYKDLTGWVGKIEGSFDLEKLLGLNAQLMIKSVDVNGKTYFNVVNVMGVSKTMKPLEPKKKPTLYTLEQGFTLSDDIPEWIKNVIKNSKEYKMFLESVPFN